MARLHSIPHMDTNNLYKNVNPHLFNLFVHSFISKFHSCALSLALCVSSVPDWFVSEFCLLYREITWIKFVSRGTAGIFRIRKTKLEIF